VAVALIFAGAAGCTGGNPRRPPFLRFRVCVRADADSGQRRGHDFFAGHVTASKVPADKFPWS
jgi:hypothetical protein